MTILLYLVEQRTTVAFCNNGQFASMAYLTAVMVLSFLMSYIHDVFFQFLL